MSEPPLFHLSPLQARYRLARSELYKEYVTSAARVWFSPGHIFVATKNFRKLSAFDIKSTSVTEELNQLNHLDLTFDLSPLHNVLFGTNGCDTCLTFVITDSGTTQVFNYEQLRGWVKLGTFELCTNCAAKVVKVTLDSISRCMYWCEESININGQTRNKVCRRSFPAGNGAWNDQNIGDPMELLEDCPISELYVESENLYIWPVQPCPTNLFVKWLPWERCLEMHAVGRGCVHVQTDVAFKSLNFLEASMSLVALWEEEDDDDEIVAVVPHPLGDDLYMINRNGDVCSVRDTKNPQIQCHLVAKPSPDSYFFMCQFALCEVNKNTIRFYSMLSGEVRQVIDARVHGNIIGVWSSISRAQEPEVKVQSVGFYTDKNAFQILMTDCRTWSANKENITRMQGARAEISAIQKTIDKESSSPIVNGRHVPDVLTNGDEFESPALPVIHLQKHRNHTTDPVLTQQTENFIQAYDSTLTNGVSTELNDSVGPLVSKYIKLQKDISDRLNGLNGHSGQMTSIEDEVVALIASDTETDLLERRIKLEMLAETSPKEVLAAIMKYLKSEEDDTSRAEMKKWRDILATESDVSQSGKILPLYEITCRLLFRDQPSQLVKFVQVAQGMSEQGFGAPGFLRKITSLHDRALDTIPDVSKSSIKYDAVIARGQLLLGSSRPHCEHEALRLLLEHDVWDSAISLVLKHAGTELHSELFSVLFVESLKRGVLTKYITEVMDLVPENTSALYVLDLMRTNLPLSDEGNVFCREGSSDIKIGTIRPYLIKFLEKPD